MLIKTSELSGAALDWAVARAVGHECGLIDRDRTIFGCNAADGRQYVIGKISHETVRECLHARYFRPSTDWAQAGPLIECELIEISPTWHYQDAACTQDWEKRGFKESHGWHWVAYDLGENNIEDNHEQEGGTPLIAAMRCIVSMKLGDEVEVPDDLLSPPL